VIMITREVGYVTTRILLICFALVLFGCAGPKEMMKSAEPVPARDVLLSKEIPTNGYGAYGYLIFTRRPSKNAMQRYMKVCDAFVRNLEPVEYFSSIASKSLMPTYWLAVNNSALKKRRPNCKAWVEFYDYPRAKIMASAVSALNSKGPLLVAWDKSFESLSQGDNALIIDLSDFSDVDLDRAFGIWMDRITRNASAWNTRLKLVLAKEAFRNFLEKYGDNIIRGISTAKEIIG